MTECTERGEGREGIRSQHRMTECTECTECTERSEGREGIRSDAA
jgi:hypothetical protein